MRKIFAWVLVLIATLLAVVMISLMPDIGKHLYPSTVGARKDAAFSLFMGLYAGLIVYAVILLWRVTKKTRTGKAYVRVDKYKPKQIGKEGFTELMFVSAHGDINKIAQLLASGVNINAQDGRGRTALMHAVINNQEEVVELLLQMGADARLSTKEGCDANWFAYNLGHNSIELALNSKAT